MPKTRSRLKETISRNSRLGVTIESAVSGNLRPSLGSIGYQLLESDGSDSSKDPGSRLRLFTLLAVLDYFMSAPYNGFDAVAVRSMKIHLSRDCGRFSRLQLRAHFGTRRAEALRRTPVMCALQRGVSLASCRRIWPNSSRRLTLSAWHPCCLRPRCAFAKKARDSTNYSRSRSSWSTILTRRVC